MSARWFGRPHHRMYMAAFLLDFSVAMGLTAMPFLLFHRLDGGAALSGTVGALQMALYSFGCLASAGFAMRARNSLAWALAGTGAFGFLFAAVPWAGTPLLCGMIASVPFLGLALAWPAMQSWMGGEPDPEVRARRLSGFNTATAFGFTLSPLLAGPLYDIDYRLPFLVLFALCAVVAALLLSLPAESSPARKEPEDESEAKGDEPFAAAGLLYASWGATFTANVLFAAVRSVYPKRVETLAADGTLTLWGDSRPVMLDTIGPATAFSWLAFLLSLATVVCFALLGWTRKWRGRFWPLVPGQLVAAASFVLLGHTRSLAAMMACFIAVGINFGMCFFASLYYSLARAERKHRRAAINEGVLGAGGFVGGIVLGYVAEGIGIPDAFNWPLPCVVVALLLQLLLLRAFGRRPVPQRTREESPLV